MSAKESTSEKSNKDTITLKPNSNSVLKLYSYNFVRKLKEHNERTVDDNLQPKLRHVNGLLSSMFQFKLKCTT